MAGERPPPAMRVRIMFWFLKKKVEGAHKAVLSVLTIFFLRLTPCWDVPPVVQSSSTNQRQPHTKKPA